ncbi:MAG: FAD-dependent oxidoreductase, partial [Kofleriaceae bacterium]
GDSAVEAALALADAGARVMISYRGKGFNRAAPKNKQAIEAYAAEGRIKAKLGSQVLQFEPDNVTLALGDGTQKRYPNDGAFVLIGADPPVQWLEKMGIHFVQRPHSHQMGKTDDCVRRVLAQALECPEDAARAAAQVLGGSTGKEPMVTTTRQPPLPMPLGEPVSGPRKWLRSATSIFSLSGKSGIHQLNAPPPPPPRRGDTSRPGKPGKRLDSPMPLSEFANRGRRASTNHHTHTGHGRRDQLTAGERTRILRMLRDEGGRMADEDSQVYLGVPPAPAGRDYDFDFDDNAPVAPPVASRPDVPAKPAVVVGLDKARRQKRGSGPPPLPGGQSRATAARPAPAKPTSSRRAPLPKPFEEPTRAVDDAELAKAARSAPGPGRVAGPFDDLPTRLGDIDAKLLDGDAVDQALSTMAGDKFIAAKTEQQSMLFDETDEATSLANLDGSLAQASGAKPPSRDERTRAVDIRNDPSMSDVDWDID